MVNFKINNETYQFPSTWVDITVKTATQLHHICDSMPPKLKDKYDIIMNGADEKELKKDIDKWIESVEDNLQIKDFPIFYGKVIEALSNVPQNLIDMTTISSRLHIYSLYLEKFVMGLMYNGAGYQSVGISSFEFNDNTYQLPTNKRMNDLIIPMEALSTVQFCEASDFMALINSQDKGFKFAAYIVAILCLKKGEIYNEDIIVDRSKEFNDLPMDIVWEVFFCLDTFLYMSLRDSLSYFHQRAVSMARFPKDLPVVGETLLMTCTLIADIPFHWN